MFVFKLLDHMEEILICRYLPVSDRVHLSNIRDGQLLFEL